jgi:hypothetical protein
MDEALTPVAEEDAAHMELYTQNDAARTAVQRELRVAGVKPKDNGATPENGATLQDNGANGQAELAAHGNGHAGNGHAEAESGDPQDRDEQGPEISPSA